MRLSDRVFAKSRGKPEDVIAFARANGAERMDFLEAWAREVYRLCALAGMDASLPIAQSHLETGGWKNNRFWDQGNPAGMGVPSDPSQIEAHVFDTGEHAAAAQVVHLALYATGGVPLALAEYQDYDFRRDDYVAEFGTNATARTIDEFGSGKWAEDDAYSEKWVGRGNLIWSNLPNQEAGSAPPQPTGKKITYRAILDPSEKVEPTVSQGFGSTPFARSTCEVGSPFYRMYWYGRDGGLDGCSHPAEDWAMPRGTQVYSPVNGVVEVAGGTPYYTFYGDGSPGVGQLSIITESGDRLTFGHMMRIAVKAGATVKPGDKVGLSGGFNGDHLHVEVQKNKTTYSDPRAYDYGTRAVTPTPQPVPAGKFSKVIPGLPGGPLVTDYEVLVNLIPVRAPQRTGAKASQPRDSVQHGTGNDKSEDARNEAQGWFINEHGGDQWVSVHACGDDVRVVVTLPFDEVGVHAGSSEGNRRGFAYEVMEGSALWSSAPRRDNATRIAADFMGRASARLASQGPSKHAKYGNGNCPDKFQHVTRNGRPYWDDLYAPTWRAARADELKRMAGDVPPPPPPDPPQPVPPKPPSPTPTPNPIPAVMKTHLAQAEKLGLDLATLRQRFGTAVDGYAFDVYGQVSLAWLHDGLEDGEYPALAQVNEVSPTSRFFWFVDGTGYRWNGTKINRLRQTGADDPAVFGVKVEADERPATTRNKRKAAKWTVL